MMEPTPKPPKLNKWSALAILAVAVGSAGYYVTAGEWLLQPEHVLELSFAALAVFGLHVRDVGLFRRALHSPPPQDVLE